MRIGTLDPLDDQPFPAPRAFASRCLAAACFEGLVRLDAMGHPVPAIASAWSTPDFRLWRFYIRKDLQFHDGTPLRLTHIQDAWQETLRKRGLTLASWPLGAIQGVRAFLQGSTSTIEGIRCIPEHIIELHLTRPFPQFLEALTEPGAWIALRKEETWQGTGAFQIQAWDPDRIQLRAWEDYPGGRPYLDGIDAVVRQESQRAFDFETGTLDLLWDADTGQEIPVWVAIEFAEASSLPSRWRTAIRYAIDIDDLLRFRQLDSPTRMRFVGEALITHPAWKSYQPFKAHRLVRQSAPLQQGPIRLGFTPTPESTGVAVSRRLQRYLSHAGIETELRLDREHTGNDLNLLCLEMPDRLIRSIAPGGEIGAVLLLYRDQLKVKIASVVRGWQLISNRPCWQLMWLGRAGP